MLTRREFDPRLIGLAIIVVLAGWVLTRIVVTAPSLPNLFNLNAGEVGAITELTYWGETYGSDIEPFAIPAPALQRPLAYWGGTYGSDIEPFEIPASAIEQPLAYWGGTYGSDIEP